MLNEQEVFMAHDLGWLRRRSLYASPPWVGCEFTAHPIAFDLVSLVLKRLMLRVGRPRIALT